MPRNMSFMLTTEQIRNRTKTVTRRLGWWFLKPGDIVNAVEKGMGLKKGEKVKRICQIRVVSTRKECVAYISMSDIIKEGFGNVPLEDFINLFCEHNDCNPYTIVNRIEFEYI